MSSTTPDPTRDGSGSTGSARATEVADPTAATAALPADLQDERLIADAGGIGGMVRSFVARFRSGDLGALPVVIGLVIIWLVFQSLNDAFLSPRNLVNLTLQSAAIGTIAIGIVLVLLLGEIDLSVGSVSGLSAAVVAVGSVGRGWPIIVALLLAVAVGAVVGIAYGAMFTRFGVPSFVITLAGLLGFLGLQLKVLGAEGSINLPFESGLVKFAQATFLPAVVAYVIALAAVALYAATRLRSNTRRAAAGLSTVPVNMIVVRSVLLALLLVVPVAVLNRDRGVSVMFLVFLALVVVMDFAIRRTRWGRSVMAVGGNVEAARRAGINVNRVYLSVFALCSSFAALGGIFAAARLAAANQSSGGVDTNLNAIAAAVIGGTSLFGGRGSAYAALLGILVIQSISNGLALINLGSPERYMITGGVLLLAVTVDALSRRTRAAAGRA
ncbi:sugar ABC transporter permease [Terracoccus luteus]|uniref:Xylose transport system permease protein XylH n=1 Tax=Terracoccus luteus TaxID=53356 RepID=A0A495Y2M2_9MICO|nr:sugar ABC transporter permease [Terracoccus luteus]MBB2986556.1 ABC-type xylose transport system permease subunit [Terracoccus luteus]MCP2171855.1 ABC-type xylose transport system permease subunit [Terracoccus luteus]RKT79306.1 simple sugar transport system permease protein/D-xylose transport system permease protein [Terracoccus luteus]